VSRQRILAFDCSLDAFSALLAEDGEVRARLHRAKGTWRAEQLVPELAGLLEQSGWSWRELDLLVPVVGPGSFTGVRTAVAATRALALAARLVILPVSTFEAMAAAARAGEPLSAVIPGRRQMAWVQAFDASGRPETAPAAVPVEELAAHAGGRHVIAARAARLPTALREGLAVREVEPDAAGALQAALRRLAAGDRPVPGHLVRPLYLRPPDADPRAGRPLVDAA